MAATASAASTAASSCSETARPWPSPPPPPPVGGALTRMGSAVRRRRRTPPRRAPRRAHGDGRGRDDGGVEVRERGGLGGGRLHLRRGTRRSSCWRRARPAGVAANTPVMGPPIIFSARLWNEADHGAATLVISAEVVRGRWTAQGRGVGVVVVRVLHVGHERREGDEAGEDDRAGVRGELRGEGLAGGELGAEAGDERDLRDAAVDELGRPAAEGHGVHGLLHGGLGRGRSGAEHASSIEAFTATRAPRTVAERRRARGRDGGEGGGGEGHGGHGDVEEGGSVRECLLCVQEWRPRGGGDALKRIVFAFVCVFVDVSQPTLSKTPRRLFCASEVLFVTWPFVSRLRSDDRPADDLRENCCSL